MMAVTHPGLLGDEDVMHGAEGIEFVIIVHHILLL
jgi:hypothetical protein